MKFGKNTPMALMLVVLLFLGMFIFSFVPSVKAYITVDGDPSEWSADTSSQPNNTGQYYAGVGWKEYAWVDAVDDDVGDGDYTYPTGAVYTGNDGADLTEFRATAISTHLFFLVKLASLPNPWAGPNGFSLPLINIYIDQDPGTQTGYNTTIDPRWYDNPPDGFPTDADFAREYFAWEYAVAVQGWGAYVMNGTISSVAGGNQTVISAKGDSVHKAIEIAVPFTALGKTEFPNETWRFVVIIGLARYESFSEVLETATDYVPGGGIGTVDMNPLSPRPWESNDTECDAFDGAFYNTTVNQALDWSDYNAVTNRTTILCNTGQGFANISLSDIYTAAAPPPPPPPPPPIDGDPSDWLADTSLQPNNTGQYYVTAAGGEYAWVDAVDDDVGDGDYTYPTDAVYTGNNSADLTEFRVRATSAYLVFLLKLASLPNPWAGPNGFSFPIINIYIDQDPDTQKGYNTTATHGYIEPSAATDADFAREYFAWEYVVAINGWDAFVMDSPTNRKGDIIVAGDPAYNAIEAAVPFTELNRTERPTDETWRFVVIIGINSFGTFNEVLETAQQWYPGGGLGVTPWGGGRPWESNDTECDAFDGAFYNTTVNQALDWSDYNAVTNRTTILCNIGQGFADINFSNVIWEWRDVALTSITTFSSNHGPPSDPYTPVTECYPTWTIKINVTVQNQGIDNITESITVQVFYGNSTGNYTIGITPTSYFITLAPGASTSKVFTWDVPEIPFAHPYPTYTIYANVSVVPSEIDIADNIRDGVVVTVKWRGDGNGDGKVGLPDLMILAQSYGKEPGDPSYNPQADFSGDGGKIGLPDLMLLAQNYGKGPLD